jgi:hypothetical protein
MRSFRFSALVPALIISMSSAFSQGDRIRALTPMIGTWTGKAVFTSKTPPVDQPIDCILKVSTTVQGRYYQFDESVLVPHDPEDTLMLLTYDPQKYLFEGWLFNPGNPGPKLLTGTLERVIIKDGKELQFDPQVKYPAGTVMEDHLDLGALASPSSGPALKEHYVFTKPDEFTLTVSAKYGENWAVVYKVTFDRKKDAI